MQIFFRTLLDSVLWLKCQVLILYQFSFLVLNIKFQFFVLLFVKTTKQVKTEGFYAVSDLRSKAVVGAVVLVSKKACHDCNK